MTDFLQFIINEACMFELHQKEINKGFKKRAEEAEKLYWDACKYPRKKKKTIRKKAKADYSFYLKMSEPLWAY